MSNHIDDEQAWKQLNERAKELNCLYEVDKITSRFELDLEQVMIQIISILPQGWRYPDRCRVEIYCSGMYFSSEELLRTELKQSTSILIDTEKIGEINIYYIKPVKSEKGIFLAEEQRLLNAVSEKIANFIRYKRLTDVAISRDTANNTRISENGLLDWLRGFHLNEAQIKQLLTVPIQFKKGETIGKQGAITSYFLLQAEGLTKSYLESPSRNYNFMITVPFDFIGLSSLFGNHYYFSTTALTSSLVYLIDKQLFIQLLTQNPSFNIAIMKWYCNSYKIVFQKLNCIANKQAIGRMSDTLLYLCQDVFFSNIIPGTITRKDIASLSGISTENAVRILSDFKNDGIISIVSNQIEINRMDILKTLSMAG
jgi:CRP-like cAMP-binding protein